MKRCLIVDGNSILNRAFYGIRPLTTKTGKHTNAIFGMCNILFRQIDAIKPDYVAVAFDLKAPNFRKERFPAYKEGRHPTPPELSSQFPDAKAFLRVLGFHVLELAGYEADDILGTLAELAKKTPDTHTYILSGDRDLLQLIDDKTSVLLVTTGDTPTYNRNLFFEKYGVEPHELVAVKALMGDSSDNIPGVAGVGEKTALKLIAEYHTLDNIYANIEDKIIKPGVREKLLRDREMAELSYFLATIACDAPLNLALEDIRRKEFDKQALYQKCIELEFYAFIKKFNLNPAEFETAFAETSDAPTTFVAESTTQETDANQISTSDLNENHMPSQSSASRAEENAPVYQVVDAKKLIASLLKTFAVTHDATLAHPFSFYDGKHAFLYDGELAQLAELFGGDYTVICVDGKAFLHQCYDANLSPNFTPQDILLASYVLNPSSGNATFPSLAMQFLGQSLKADGGNANLAFELFSLLLEKIKEAKSEKVLCDIELPLAPILCRMERFGFKLDIKGLSAFGETLCKTMDALRENIFMHAGEHFNINSPKQLSEVLFQKLLLPTEKSKKNRNGFSTDVEVLQSLRHMHPIIEDILDYRQIAKLYSTYVQGLLKVADENGRVHTDFKQSLTATGRLSSAEPNLQNIPIRTKLGRVHGTEYCIGTVCWTTTNGV